MLTSSSSSSQSPEPDRSGLVAASPRRYESEHDEPRHPKPRDFVKPVESAAAVDVPAAPPVTEASAADHVDGDTVVTSSAVGSAATAQPVAVQPVAAHTSTAQPEVAPQAVAAAPPVETAMRAQPVVRAERIQPSPTLVAKVVPVAKAIPAAEPARHAPRAIAIAEPVVEAGAVAIAVPVASPAPAAVPKIIVTGATKSASSNEQDPNAVPLTVLGRWLWHVRNFGIAANVSIFLHVIAIVVLGNIALNTPAKPEPPPELECTVEPVVIKEIEPPKIETVQLAPLQQAKTTAVSRGRGAGSQGAGGGVGGGAVGGMHLNPIKIDGVANLSTGGAAFGTDQAYGNDMLGEVGETLDPKDAKATFFGVEATGKSFVFVVDTSGSMDINERYKRCRAELLRSIGALKYQQKYFVVFFNHTTFAMPERKLVEARPAQITKTQEWCKLAVPSGGTDPWDGLQMALRLKPDAIYLLTDGDFSPEVVQRLAHAQPQTKKIPVHTICFESLSGAPVMEAIAKQTNATYLYVP